MARTHALMAIVAAVYATLTITHFSQLEAPDLLATWLAGEFYAAGALDQIYPPATPLFTMETPSAWRPHMDAQGYTGFLFPYIYPPLWVVPVSKLTGWIDYQTFKIVMLGAYALMLAHMLVMAERMTRGAISPLAYLALGLAILWLTLPGWVALSQAQPQILVSYLLVLALERQMAGKPLAAGTALAFAAALKIYPLFFALIWLAARDWRAFGTFVVIGAALGGLSIALVGWPLHADFLAQLSRINGTILVNNVNYAFQAIATALVLGGDLAQAGEVSVQTGHYAVPKPPALNLLSPALLLGLVAALMALVWKKPTLARDPLFWASAIALLALFSPLAWAHYFVPVFVFIPSLIHRLGPTRAALLLVPALLVLSMPAVGLILDHSRITLMPAYTGAAGVTLITAAFLWALARHHRKGLRPETAPL